MEKPTYEGNTCGRYRDECPHDPDEKMYCNKYKVPCGSEPYNCGGMMIQVQSRCRECLDEYPK